MGTKAAILPPTAVKRTTPTGDLVARGVVLFFAALVLLITVVLVYQLWIGSAAARQRLGWGFLFSSQWDPVSLKFGALPFIYGTVVTSVLALLISVPLGLGAAIFLSELAPAGISSALTFLVELLAAIPSVIFGLLAIFTLVPKITLGMAASSSTRNVSALDIPAGASSDKKIAAPKPSGTEISSARTDVTTVP